MDDPPPEEKKPEPSRTKLIVILVLHVLFHAFYIGFLIWATVHYIQYGCILLSLDKGSRACYKQDDVTDDEETREDAIKIGNATRPSTTTTEATTTTTTTFKPHILCEMNWCIGYGFFVLLFIIFYIFWIYYWIFKPLIGIRLYNDHINPIIVRWMMFSRRTLVSAIMLTVVIVLVFGYLIFECRDKWSKLIGLSGPVVFILLGVACSKYIRQIQWRIVVHGLLGQFLLAVFCLRLEFGRKIFDCIGQKVVRFLSFTQFGARFVYGDTIYEMFVFAFGILAVVFFFSVVTSVLYYLGAMQFFLNAAGFLLQATVGTTVCESVNAVANVFLSMSEGPLMIRPYIPILTKSELHTICTSGYATVAGSVLNAYISYGASPAYLVTASVMAAPGSLAFSKLFYPETEESLTRSDNIQLEKSSDQTILDAAASGAAIAIQIVLGIVANIIAFLSIFYFLDAVVEWHFELIGYSGITLLWILSRLFVPLVLMMGVNTNDCLDMARIVAEKTIINEFVAYRNLGEIMKRETNPVDPRSIGIVTFAICGFANPGSLGIMMAALSAMAPTRRVDITNVCVRAFFAGTFVSFTSASIAGILIQEDQLKKMSGRMLHEFVEDYRYLPYGYNYD